MDWASSRSVSPSGAVQDVSPDVEGTPEAMRISVAPSPGGVMPGVATLVVPVDAVWAIVGAVVEALEYAHVSTTPSAVSAWVKFHSSGSLLPAIFHQTRTCSRLSPAEYSSSSSHSAPPAGAGMLARAPTSAAWWASSRSPACTPSGLNAGSGVVRPNTACRVPRSSGNWPVYVAGEPMAAVAVTVAGVAVDDCST
ncbi:hypothetical protein [Nonomuraea rubra]|uniref:hypothetical protein n=1 Tax=Nonomuraea rubra TaxID=46180 RepID=UPI0031E6C9AC